MANLRELLAEAGKELQGAGTGEPRLTAEILLAHVLGRERSYLYAHPEEVPDADAEARWRTAVGARRAGTPLQYITGEQEFHGRRFMVSPAVLIPRPETELTVAAALERMPAEGRVVDVGTGSGCIAVTLGLERPAARIVATDLSAAALALAQANAARLGARVDFVRADLLAPLGGRFDLIVSNPPYVAEGELASLQAEVREHEPRLALTPGPKGDEIYKRLIPEVRAALAPGGWLVLEIGYDSARTLAPMLAESEWAEIFTITDTLGWQRVVCARR